LENILARKKYSFNYAYENLDLVLNQKREIKPSFVNYTSDLTYDIRVYKHFFDSIDKEIEKETEKEKLVIVKDVLQEQGRQFMSFFDNKLDDLNNEVKNFSKKEHEKHGFYLRKQIWDIILTSQFLTRTNTKPRGYSGDSQILAMIYDNEYVGKTIFSKIMHKHPIETTAAQAVRTRRGFISKLLRSLYEERFSKINESLKFLSVACGSAVELQDIFKAKEDAGKFECTLLDQDILALNEAKENIQKINEYLKRKIKVNFFIESVRTMFSGESDLVNKEQFHFIYALGLFDYLTLPTAKVVLRRLYDMLKPNGKLLIGNFHFSNPTLYYMEYWGDWVLYYRTEEELLDLVSDIPNVRADIYFSSEVKCQMYLEVEKLA